MIVLIFLDVFVVENIFTILVHLRDILRLARRGIDLRR